MPTLPISTIEGDIDKFFLPPCPKENLPTSLQQSGERPILHLLRRDLEKLYREEKFLTPDENDIHGPPFFSCLGILSGIDTLSRFVIPEFNKKGKHIGAGEKFQAFLKKIVGMRKYETRVMWALRNALSHSYTLRLEGKLHKGARVIISDGTMEDGWLTRRYHRQKRQRIFIINLWEFKALFLEQAIPLARQALKDQKRKTLRKRFQRRYETHGRIFVRSAAEKASGARRGKVNDRVQERADASV